MGRDQRLEAEIRARARSAYGLLETAELRAMGLSSSAIRWRMNSGEFEAVLPGVVRTAGAPDSFRQDALAATKSVGLGSVLSAGAAAALYGFPGFPPRQVEVLVMAESLRRRRFGKGVIVHRTNHLCDEDVTVFRGIPCTSPARTLFDVAATCSFDSLRRATLSCVKKRLTTPAQLHDQRKRLCKQGRPGSTRFAQLCDEVDLEDVKTDSDLEDVAFDLIRNFGLPEPQRQLAVVEEGAYLGTPDLAYPPPICTLIECVGHEFHSSRPDFFRDASRYNTFVAYGYTLLLFTYEDSEHPYRFITVLRRVLRLRGSL